jgi:hypothetical protein
MFPEEMNREDSGRVVEENCKNAAKTCSVVNAWNLRKRRAEAGTRDVNCSASATGTR